MTEFATVAELLADPVRWTTSKMARNAMGTSVLINAADACCWCLLGAIAKVYGWQGNQEALLKVSNVLGVVGPHAISHFNDHATHAEVLDIVRRAGI